MSDDNIKQFPQKFCVAKYDDGDDELNPNLWEKTREERTGAMRFHNDILQQEYIIFRIFPEGNSTQGTAKTVYEWRDVPHLVSGGVA